MGPINISVRTLMISCDYLRCLVITIFQWINSDIKQICPLRFVSIAQKLVTLRFIVNYGNLKWFTGNRKWFIYVYTIYLHQICIGPARKCLLGKVCVLALFIEKWPFCVHFSVVSKYLVNRGKIRSISNTKFAGYHKLAYFKVVNVREYVGFRVDFAHATLQCIDKNNATIYSIVCQGSFVLHTLVSASAY